LEVRDDGLGKEELGTWNWEVRVQRNVGIGFLIVAKLVETRDTP
jgi:hypothetical protein